MALQNGVTAFLLQYPFTLYKSPTLPPTKGPPDHHIASTMLDRWRQTLLQHLYIFSASHKCSSCDLNKSHLFGILLESPLAVAKAAATIPGVHRKHET